MARIEGTAGADLLEGGYLADRILGYDGDDTLDGGGGADRIYGGAGNDLIRAAEGDVIAAGGGGNDTIQGGRGNQTLLGGAGDDVLALRFHDWWYGGDPIYSQQAYGGSGNDILQFMVGMNADLFGGTGTDTARYVGYSTKSASMTMSLAGFTTSDGLSGTYDSMERLQFFADYGVQHVTGGDLDDQIYVGAGDDTVQAGAGDDTVGYRYYGHHVLDGGDGIDTLVLEGLGRISLHFVVQDDGSVDDRMQSDIRGFERYLVFGQGRADDFISLGDGDDTGAGYAGEDTIFGKGGNDLLSGGAGGDMLYGGDGDDTLKGGGGSDVIEGGSGDDLLIAGYGADTVYGGDGNDRLLDGVDAAVLFGGAGRDRFVLKGAETPADLIGDFTSGEDVLVIATGRLSGFAGITGTLGAGDLAFGAADRAGGQLVLTEDAGLDETILWWDVDGSAGAGLMVALVRFDGTGLDISHSDITLL
ncbi:calcium-binding protein [Gemmobacter nectariphilus]|uniref:calcium-binding protein n=1 Tax=Gemmobacter nectariphilus TaxID=220343 RepID=UPI0004240C3D|nr:calcium-binding protein [Gemmobacter nectariphilus]